MQPVFSFGQSADLRAMRARLRTFFGPEPEGFRARAIDQFILSFISSQTYDRVSWDAFLRLLNRYSGPQELADAPVAEIATLLEGVTRPKEKAEGLKSALQKIGVRAGTIDLEFLHDLDVETALVWLEQIRGVGRKIAAATLNFSVLRKRAFVADTHVLRIMQRFGFVKPNGNEIAVFDAVMEAADGFSADDLYELHWHLKAVGQQICRPFRAECATCPLSEICLKRVEESAAAHAGHAA
jgi:endonuclease-3